MAQTSPHQVVLSDEQRRELERRAAAYSGPYRDVVRAKAILLAADGLSTRRLPSGWGSRVRLSRRGENGSARKGCKVSKRDRGRVGRGVFPPAQVAEVKALACELPAEQGVPLSRWSSAELAREAVKRGIVATIAAITIWRWLARGRDPPVELPLVDLPARPEVRAEGRPGAGSVRGPVGGAAARARRLCRVRR